MGITPKEAKDLEESFQTVIDQIEEYKATGTLQGKHVMTDAIIALVNWQITRRNSSRMLFASYLVSAVATDANASPILGAYIEFLRMEKAYNG